MPGSIYYCSGSFGTIRPGPRIRSGSSRLESQRLNSCGALNITEQSKHWKNSVRYQSPFGFCTRTCT